jgi:pyruvate/2-oxoglutarate dehydrogenase complex dihydrolipoamide dehydrogenase (E3) component
MVASARVAYLTRRSAEYGVHVSAPTVTMAEVRQRKRDIVDSFRDGGQKRLERAKNLELIFGEASFEGPRRIRVQPNEGGELHLEADHVFIDAGARPAVPRIEGIEQVPLLNSTTIMELDELPGHLLVLGGGYVGLEFGQMFRRFGSEVTIIQRGKQLLSREDQDVADAVADILHEDGVQVLLESEAKRVERTADGRIRLTVSTREGDREFVGTHLLCAAGRTPNTETLNLASAGVEVDRGGFIKANDRLETSAPGVYAIGDIKGGPAFTHISYDDYRNLETNLLKGGNATIAGRPVPYTVFIDPQLGCIGLSEREAREAGHDIKVAKMPMTYVARALEVSESRGFMKAIVDAQTKQILGCAILGIEGGELMSMLQIAMMGHVPYPALRDAIFAHPTLAESFNNLFAMIEE